MLDIDQRSNYQHNHILFSKKAEQGNISKVPFLACNESRQGDSLHLVWEKEEHEHIVKQANCERQV